MLDEAYDRAMDELDAADDEPAEAPKRCSPEILQPIRDRRFATGPMLLWSGGTEPPNCDPVPHSAKCT